MGRDILPLTRHQCQHHNKKLSTQNRDNSNLTFFVVHHDFLFFLLDLPISLLLHVVWLTSLTFVLLGRRVRRYYVLRRGHGSWASYVTASGSSKPATASPQVTSRSMSLWRQRPVLAAGAAAVWWDDGPFRVRTERFAVQHQLADGASAFVAAQP